jgi:hypothetical protein
MRRIAMWSGPRNISTAMMRAWGNRADTAVVDEPFYAFYLEKTGVPHPGAGEIIAAGETDWRKVVAQLTGPAPHNRAIFYQKQMTQHLLPEVSRDWLPQVTNCFLIRDPAAVITSYIKKNSDPTAVDLGYPQQIELFQNVCRCVGTPPIVDADDVLRDPERMLRMLCSAVGVAFDMAMLSWARGGRETDGVWAKYWYQEVERSTKFQSYTPKQHIIPSRLRDVHERCRAIYDELYAKRLV